MPMAAVVAVLVVCSLALPLLLLAHFPSRSVPAVAERLRVTTTGPVAILRPSASLQPVAAAVAAQATAAMVYLEVQVVVVAASLAQAVPEPAGRAILAATAPMVRTA